MRLLKAVLVLFAAMLASALGWLWYLRRGLSYNSEGRYFDAVSGVSYDQGAVTVYGAAAVIAGFATALLAKWALRR